MARRSMRELWDEVERHPDFHKEVAILEFTEELWRVMHEQGVSGTELGRRIGSSQAYISRVLNGGANFTLGSMTKLAMGLGVDLRLHLAPARTRTVWRDISLDAVSADGDRLITLGVQDAPGPTSRYATAPSTPYAAVTLPQSEVSRGAAACAA